MRYGAVALTAAELAAAMADLPPPPLPGQPPASGATRADVFEWLDSGVRDRLGATGLWISVAAGCGDRDGDRGRRGEKGAGESVGRR